MVPHTMSVLDALTHMSEKHYLHLPVSGGDSTLADGTSGLVDALQLITHMLRPPLPELGEDTKNQGKDPDVLRKLLRMSGVGVDIGDMSYSEDTESRAGGNYDDDDRSSVFSRTLQEDSISHHCVECNNFAKEISSKNLICIWNLYFQYFGNGCLDHAHQAKCISELLPLESEEAYRIQF